MITLARRKVYDLSYKTYLEHLLDLKMEYEHAVLIMKLLQFILTEIELQKTPYFVQVVKFGGERDITATSPPYCTFTDDEDRIAFESTFNEYIDQDESVSEFTAFNINILTADHAGLPPSLETDLTGIVTISQV